MTIVVGEVVGSGIFFKPEEVSRAIGGYPALILALWVTCGVVNLFGALALAELSAMFPHEGGTYVFLRETYGRMWAFLWCWSEFWVIRTGAIAALAVYTTMSWQDLMQAAGIQITSGSWKWFRMAAAVSIIFALGAINFAGALWGGRVQNVMTSIKVAFVALLALLPFLAIRGPGAAREAFWPAQVDGTLLTSIGVALAAIMWAYDGWGNVTVVAEEVRDPERNVPRALVAGMLLIMVLYFGANLAYYLTLPSAQIAATFNPARAVCEKLLPGFGGNLLLAMLMVSLIGTLNGNILVGPRVLYAAARDFHFLSPFRQLHPRTRTPALAIGLVSGWSMLLVILADWSPGDTPLYQWLTNYCIFGGSIFYLSAVLAVFMLRIRQPSASRPYRAWGYPLTPAIFAVFYLFLLASMLWSRPQECFTGLALIAAGLVVYLLLSHRSKGS